MAEKAWLWVVRLSGMAIVGYETLREPPLDRPSLLVLAGGMIMFKTVVEGAKKIGNGR